MPLELAALTVRPAFLDDVEVLVDLARRTFYETFVGTCSDADMDLFLATTYTVENFAAELAAPHSWYLLLESPTGPLGYSRLALDPQPPSFLAGLPALELVRFYLDRPAHGTGAAHLLMQANIDLAAAQGYSRLYLGVWENNHRAQRFYQKWGFRRVGEKVFLVGTDAQTDWYFLRDPAQP